MLKAFHTEGIREAGCDEAGRGCLAGPVYAAAVIMPVDFSHPLLNDSKKMTAAQRQEARAVVEEHALAWAVGEVSPREIDEINILNASFLAMHRALDQLDPCPEALLIDGNRFQPWRAECAFHCIVKGDGIYRSIAAASILAKTYRDDYMQQIAVDYPQYDWMSNKGYPTRAHRAAIIQHGATPHHRQSFRLLPQAEQGELF